MKSCRLLVFLGAIFATCVCSATILVPVAVRGEMVVADGKLYFIQEPGSLTILNLSSGQVVNRVKLESRDLGQRPVPSDGSVALIGYEEVHLVEQRTGKVLFHVSAEIATANESTIAYSISNYEVALLDRKNLSTRKLSIPLPDGEVLTEIRFRGKHLVAVSSNESYSQKHLFVFDAESHDLLGQRISARSNLVNRYFGNDALIEIRRREPDPPLDILSMDSLEEDWQEKHTVDDYAYFVSKYDSIDQRVERTASKAKLAFRDPEQSNEVNFDGENVIVDGVFLGWNGESPITLGADYQSDIERLSKSVDATSPHSWIKMTAGNAFLMVASTEYPAQFTAIESPGGWRRAFSAIDEHVQPYVAQVLADPDSNSVVVNTNDGRIECLNADTGDLRWAYTFAYSWGMMSTNSGYVGPYWDQEEEKHLSRVKASESLANSVSIPNSATLIDFVAKPFPSQSDDAIRVSDPAPDLVFPDRLQRVGVVRSKMLWSIFCVLAFLVLPVAAGTQSRTDNVKLLITCWLCVVLAIAFHFVASLLWNHHRLDSSLNLQLKLTCVSFAVFMIAIVIRKCWKKQYLMATLVLSLVGILLYVNWRPLVYP